MSEVKISINGRELSVAPQTSVAAAILEICQTFRTSVTNQPRSAFCGMGICYECRVTINGQPHARSCQILCQPGMKIVTG